MRWILVATLFTATAASAAGTRGGSSVFGSKHDLSVTGPGPIKAESETRVCIFCHISHGASATAKHLSSRPEIGNSHVPYGSSTSRSAAQAPTGSSRVCLSCHDGTIAVGETLAGTIRMNGATAGGRIPGTRRSNLGTDLRRTHPVSIDGAAKGTRAPSPASPVRLDAGKVQCTSCHEPHAEFGGAPEGKFLRETTRDARLCGTCHAVAAGTSHATSSRPFGAAQGNDLGYRSVAEAGCMACHRSHGADARGRLLARAETEVDDALCLRCHAGAAAQADIGRQVSKPSAHVMPPDGKHDPAEGPDASARRLPEVSAAAPRHVACVDCHDPHAATSVRGVVPFAGGSLAGVWGIDQAGNRVAPASREYEICFKCHADSANKPGFGAGKLAAPRRAAQDDNLRRVFDPSSPSSHPVTAPGRNADVPSLIPALTATRQVYCTDCHSSDDGPGAGGSGARGPHGSIYPYLLERSYVVGDSAPESPMTYALCYKCHDRDVLLSTRSAFPLHRRHVVEQQTPCSVCHSSHGVSALRGTATGNAHLIDFDLNVVKRVAGALQPYTSDGPRRGTCSVSCHGTTHDAVPYPGFALPTHKAARSTSHGYRPILRD